MNPQEPSARRLVKSISLLPPREREMYHQGPRAPTLVPIRYTPTDPRSGEMNPQEPSAPQISVSATVLSIETFEKYSAIFQNA